MPLSGCALWKLSTNGSTPRLSLSSASSFRESEVVAWPEVSERDVTLPDGRILHTYDTGPDSDTSGLTVLWHHGSPQTGVLPDPLRAAAADRGIRLLSYGRPSYGGSTSYPGRSIGSVANDVAQILDAVGVDRIATMGASGGGPHALACAALLPDRVVAAVTLAGPAPYTSDLDWYAGMVAPEGPRTAAEGREARARYAEVGEFDQNSFTAADYAALEGEWASLGADAGRAGRAGPDGLIDDDVALVSPWGFDVTQIEAPVLLVHGGEDRVIPASHSDWLVRHLPAAEFWLRPRDGHISVLHAVPVAFDWLRAR
jgi:pimeloyl-ACP methyl ester carboxylesterase